MWKIPVDESGMVILAAVNTARISPSRRVLPSHTSSVRRITAQAWEWSVA
ncbi:MAG: hypothetical protein LBP19_00495 [Treponema sp.]|nr:hypothetical protein [Treponema sp.]